MSLLVWLVCVVVVLLVSSVVSSMCNIVCFMWFFVGGDGWFYGLCIIEVKGK